MLFWIVKFPRDGMPDEREIKCWKSIDKNEKLIYIDSYNYSTVANSGNWFVIIIKKNVATL